MTTTTTKAVLFDLDGTLIDTAPDFIRIIKQMCQNYDHACPSDAAIREQVSAGARAMVRLMFGADSDFNDEKLLAYRQEFLDLYEADICVDSRVFAGLDSLLLALEKKGVAWGIVTNKPRYLAEQLLAKISLGGKPLAEHCAVLVCPDDVANTKPDPEPLFLACQQLGIAPQTAIYVGDHIRDIQAGNAAGMTTVVAKFGYLSKDDHATLDGWQADVVIDTPDELAQFVLTQLS
ncbi:phosphoglycolate phosphatase [Moraxella caviae]|uniref:Phosphoglycolate phosphatase n=1 Tax=Moraxella caviae TaxID=34060 RepID=A0A1T0A9N0_9GAMM|nr:HAD-IA family hydrolase [Moraxella caviae]OOR92358.1 phosphoglycolate phosphatase [Moraxella caviae]STZ10573.1 Phosphoglycolate phosphatase [Moraxella caviae]